MQGVIEREGVLVEKEEQQEEDDTVENAETAESALTLPKRPPTVRVEFKIHP